jgi:hypothetical protein
MNYPLRTFLQESDGQGGLRPIEGVSTPHAGVWWCDATTVVGVVDPAPVASPVGRLDSDLAHADLWPLVAALFGKRPRSEYFEVPRGRVLLTSDASEGIVIGGSSTSDAQVAAIARAFGLAQWRFERDEHYEVGDDADAIFDAW